MKDLQKTSSICPQEEQRIEAKIAKTKRLNVEVDYEFYRKLKHVCYYNDISISEFTRRLLNDALKAKF